MKRDARTHQLCVRGGDLNRLLHRPDDLTDEQVKQFLQEVSLPFTVESGRQAQFYHIFYLNPNGEVERLQTIYYEEMLGVWLYHFSEYAIVYDETQKNATDSISTYKNLTEEQKKQAKELMDCTIIF